MTTFILVIIFVSVVFALKELLGKNKKRPQRGSWYAPRYRANKNIAPKYKVDITSPEKQLIHVSSDDVEFKSEKLMRYGEYKVFNLIEREVIPQFKGCRVFAQVSLGEILSSKCNSAYQCINSKRVDILIIDGAGNPVVVVEYQGEGHYKKNAPARDAVKKEALRKAGIGYIEVTPEHEKDDIEHTVKRALEFRLGTNNDSVGVEQVLSVN